MLNFGIVMARSDFRRTVTVNVSDLTVSRMRVYSSSVAISGSDCLCHSVCW